MGQSNFEEYVRAMLKQTAETSTTSEVDEVSPIAMPSYVLAGLSRTERISRFEILNQLGAGGFGAVFLARDTNSDELRALKLPMPHVMLEPDSLRRFRLDGRVGLNLDHPGIVKVHELGETGGIPYIAADYVEGPTLEAWLKPFRQGVSVDVAVEIGMRLADAIGYAHSKKIVHRDLKPANILMARAQGDESAVAGFRPCVTDFGLAQVRDDLRGSAVSSSAAMIGSIPYMAPEQITGPNTLISPATDVYALGTILFRMLTGTMPFTGHSSEWLIRQIVSDEAPSVRSRRRDVPADLETICQKCLRKKPRHRYGDAGDLLADLERFRKGERILARPTPRWEKAWAWGRKHPTASVAGLATVLAAIAIIGLQNVQNRELRRMVARLDEANKRAERHAQEAEANLRIAEGQTRMRVLVGYDRQLIKAQEAIEDHDALLAQQLLTEVDPGPEHREFVWNHLWRKSRESLELLWTSDRTPDLNDVIESPSGRWAIVKDGSNYAHLWDLSLKESVASFPIHNKDESFKSFHCGFTDDERYAVIVFELLGTVNNSLTPMLRTIVWDLVEGKLVAKGSADGDFLKDGLVTHFSILPDSTKLAFVKGVIIPWRKLLIWDFLTDEWSSPLDNLRWMRLSEDGKYVAGLNAAGELTIYDIADPRRFRRLHVPHGVELDRLAFDPAGAYLAGTDSNQRRILAWKAGLAGPVQPQTDMTIAIVPDWIFPLRHENHLLIESKESGPMLVNLKTEQIFPLAFDPSDPGASFPLPTPEVINPIELDRLLILKRIRQEGVGLRFLAWDMETKRQHFFPLVAQTANVTKSRDWESMLMNQGRNLLRWWPNPQNRYPQPLAGHMDEAWCAAFEPNGQRLVTGSNDTNERQTIKVWDWKTGELIRGWKGHDATVSAMAIEPKGQLLATCSLGKSGNLALWKLDTGEKLADLAALDQPVRTVAFSRDGKWLASGDKRGRCVIWNVAERVPVHDFSAGGDRVTELWFSEDDTRLITATEDGWLRFWNLENFANTHELFLGNDVTEVAVSSSGQSIAGIGSDGRISIRNAYDGNVSMNFEMNGMQPFSVLFLDDGRTLAAGDMEGNLMMWDLETGEAKFRTKAHSAQINALTLAHDGQAFASCAHDGSVRIWYAGPKLENGDQK